MVKPSLHARFNSAAFMSGVLILVIPPVCGVNAALAHAFEAHIKEHRSCVGIRVLIIANMSRGNIVV